MPPRSSWKGFLRLSLVSVPVKAYTANATGSEIRLNQLNKNTHNRIRYQKVDPEVGEIASSDIVSGYEYAKGQYVIIDPKEISHLRSQDEKAISIDGFLSPDQFDARFFAGKTYYLVPDGAVGQRPFALLREGMKGAGLAAIAEIVLSGREQVVLLRAVDDLLVMSVLHYAAKVKAPESFRDEVQESTFTPEELNLTQTLINASTLKSFDFDSYRDTYVAKLTQLIEKKVAGEEIVSVRDPEEPKIMNLMEALKQSVANAQKEEGQQTLDAPPKKKVAPSKKKKTAKKKTVPRKKAASTSRKRKTQRKTGS